jgi:group I intron endonuclease
MIGIYKITSPSNRVYVGQSVNIQRRFTTYKSRFKNKDKTINAQVKLFNSFVKYGIENHDFKIIEECSIELLNERERYWQEHFDVLYNGLNCLLTSTKDKRIVLSKEEIKRRSDFMKKRTGDKHPMYGRKGDKNPFFGKKHTDESKLKISKIHKGKKLSDENIKMIVERGKKQKLSEKHKLALVNSKKPLSKKCKPIINLENGIFYETIREAAVSLNLNRNNLKGYLNGLSRCKNKTPFIYC